MQPTTEPTIQPTLQPMSRPPLKTYLNRRTATFVVVMLLAVVVIFGGYTLYMNAKFRMVGTDPKLDKVAAISPTLNLNFNRTLNPSSLKISSRQNIIGSTKVVGKSIAIDLKVPLPLNTNFIINIQSISDQKGEAITNKVIQFTAKDLAVQDLSKAQQQALLKQQTLTPSSPESITYTGDEDLIAKGVTTAQSSDIKTALLKFNKNAHALVIVPGTTTRARHNEDLSYDTASFQVTIDKVPYNAKMNYSGITTIQLFLYNPTTAAQVFDSGVIDSTASSD